MPIQNPVALPQSGVTNISWTNATSSLVSRSPFTFQGQAQSYGGGIRFASVTVENLNRENAETWLGFLDSLNGTLGTFLFGDPHATAPVGNALGTTGHLVASNTSLADAFIIKTTDRPGVSVSNWLRRGDWIQVGDGLDSRLYKVANNVTKTTSNQTQTVYLWPKKRRAFIVDEPVILHNPVGLFRRSSGSYSYTEDNSCRFSISFDIEEVV